MKYFTDPCYDPITYEMVIPPELQWLRENHKEFVDYVWFKNNTGVPRKIEIQILEPDVAIVFALRFGKSVPLT